MIGKIKIEAFPNGAHDNLVEDELSTLEPGWAVMAADPATLPNFPFGNFDVEDVDGVPHMVADSWEPLPVPEPEPEPTPEPEQENTVWEELDAAYQEGVNTAYDI